MTAIDYASQRKRMHPLTMMIVCFIIGLAAALTYELKPPKSADWMAAFWVLCYSGMFACITSLISLWRNR